ncbi:LamB/YcsF family protein [Methylobacterium sp. A54F]
MRIDLNSDLGEGYGPWTLGDDAAMLDIVTSANVACGFHAGDPGIMVETARVAKARGVAVGAHPGFEDRQGFGRRRIPLTPAEIEHSVAYQVGAFAACAALAGHRVTYVKAHGALANLANADDAVAAAVARAVRGVDRDLILMVMPGLPAERAALDEGLATVREVYADRAYADDGQLASRALPGSVLSDADAAAAHVLRMVEDGAVTTLSGRRLPLAVDTVCVHGDSPGAVAMARAVRAALEAAGHTLAPFAG